MQLTVDIPEEQIEWIDRVSEQRHSSRDALLQEAVTAFLHRQGVLLEASPSEMGPDKAFGLWAGRGIDSVRYVESVRDEWER